MGPASGRAALLIAVLASAGCDPVVGTDAGGPTDGGRDAAVVCVEDADCEDGLACNGESRCLDGRCVAGEALRCDDGVACTLDFCSEELRRCVNRATDADGDGAIAATCLDTRGVPLGDDCDDTNPAILPGAMELCDAAGVDEDCDPTTLGGRDGDGDGYVDQACCNGASCGDDCNDAVRGASPEGTEVCNGIDDDCDGELDEDVQITVYRDADGDGRGDATAARLACAVTPGHSEHDDDCDDSSALRSPVLPEACDTIDNDCDGVADPEDTPTIATWFEDVDGDGFGDPARSVESCARPVGRYSLLGTDCDDDDPARNPGQAELCNAIDDDCNGLADFALAPGDLEDDDLDGRADARCVPTPLLPDCDDRDASSRGDAPEICDGRDNDCDSRTDEGVSVTPFYRDADGDGHGSEVSGVSFGCGSVLGYVATSDDCDDTSDTRYPGAYEGCNSRDDDCDARVDEDPSMSICPLEGGVPRSCVAGRCRVGSSECGEGRANCDGLAGNGCEVTLATDAANCGACGRRCAAEPQAASQCMASRCSAISCAGAFLDCNGDLGRSGDGCEVDGNTSELHCGGCGVQCPALPHVTVTSCVFGVCGFDPARDCDAGWADCNGAPADGCETQLGTDAHCASCSDECAVTSECDASRVCRPRVCPAPTADCDANGSCETSLSTTVTSCGACGNACSGRGATWSCTAGECRVASCVGAARDCDMLDSTGCEIDSATDVANCGACGRACAGASAVWACTSGACRVASCIGGARDCDATPTNGCEIDTDTDPNSCGACGRACPRPTGTIAPTCSAGVCAAPVCAAGRVDCNFDLGVAGGDGCETVGICARYTVSPTSRDFGSVAAGAMGAPVVITVRNAGDSPTGPTDIAILGAHPDEFVISADGCTGAVLVAGATCTVSITFAPTSTGPRSASLRVSPFPGQPGGLAFASLTGTGLISTSPATHDFGARTLGLTSAAISFMVRNPGTVGAGTLAISLVGANPGDYAIASDPCSGSTLAAGATCTVTVTFTPTATGARPATLRAVATAGGTATSALTGTGSAPIAVTPATHNFGAHTIGLPSATQIFTLSNPGTITTGPLTVSLTGTHASDVAITAQTCAGTMVAAGSSCQVTLRFNASAAGARTATLQISGAPGGTTTSALSGTGSAPIAITPSTHAYGGVTLGQTSANRIFTVTNAGSITTGILTAGYMGSHAADFPLVSDTCAGTTLAPAATCTLTYRFAPTATGVRSGTLEVSGAPGGTASASITGVAHAAITTSPTMHSFGSVNVGSSATDRTFTITNPATIPTGPLNVTSVSNPGDFTQVSGNCQGVSVPAGGNCTTTWRFTAAAAGMRSAQIRVMGTPGGDRLIPISGTGTAPITITPNSPWMGTVTTGQSSPNFSFTVTNPDVVATGPLSVGVSGPQASEFAIVSNACAGVSLAGSGTCVIEVRFSPTASGNRSATLNVSGTPGGATFANLGGAGSFPISLSGSLAFQPVSLGGSSANLVVTVTNNGTVTTGSLGPTISGPATTEIVYGTASCFPLAPGASCTFFVRLQPTGAVGPRAATFTVSATPGGSASLPITGHAIDLALGGDTMGGGHGNTSSLTNAVCPAGHAVVGFQGMSGLLLDQLQFLCAPLTMTTDTSGPMYTYPLVPGTPIMPTVAVGGSGGGSFGPISCPAGEIATGFIGRNGDDLDALSLRCDVVRAYQTGGLSFAFEKVGGGYTAEAGGPGGSGFGSFCAATMGGVYVDNTPSVVSGIAANCRSFDVAF